MPAVLEYLKITVEIFIAFGLVILFHELGHFILAKINGVAAPEFAFGMGPEIVGFDYHGTRYKICAFPIGGYVKMVGEEDDEALEAGFPPEKNFRHKSPLRKISIIFAGPAMNFVLAVLLFGSIFMIWGVPRGVQVPADRLSKSVVVEFIDPRMPAARAGLQVGDIIATVDGKPAADTQSFIKFIRSHANKEISVGILRGGKSIDLKMTPKRNSAKNWGEIGAALSPPIPREIAGVGAGTPAAAAGLKKGDIILDFGGASFDGPEYRLAASKVDLLVYRRGMKKNIGITVEGVKGARLGASLVPTVVRINPANALWLGAKQSVLVVVGTYDALRGMIKREISADGMAGPVGIIQYAASFARQGLRDLIFLFGTISIGIGIINLFPFPALDGSRIVFHIWEGIRRKPLDPRRESLIHYVGFCILIALIILVTLRDIRLWLNI